MAMLFPRLFHQVQQEGLAACRVRAQRAPCGHRRVVPEVMVEGAPHVQGEISTTDNLVNEHHCGARRRPAPLGVRLWGDATFLAAVAVWAVSRVFPGSLALPELSKS